MTADERRERIARIREIYPDGRIPCAWCGVRPPKHNFDCPVPDVSYLLDLLASPSVQRVPIVEPYADAGLPLETEIYRFLELLDVSWSHAEVTALVRFIEGRQASPTVSPAQEDTEEGLPSPEPRKVTVYRRVVRPVRAVPTFPDEPPADETVSPAVSREPLISDANNRWNKRALEASRASREVGREPEAMLLDPHEAFIAAYLCGQFDAQRGVKRAAEAWEGWSHAKAEVLRAQRVASWLPASDDDSHSDE